MRSSQVIGDALAAATGAAAIAVDTATGAAATAMVLACAAGDGMVVETSDGGAAGAGARTATAIGGSVCFGAGFGSTSATIFESVATETSPQFSKRSADTIAIRNPNRPPPRKMAPPAPPLLRMGIDESIRRRAAEAQHITMLEPLRPANPITIDEGARPGFEIGQVVAAARVSDGRMAIRNAWIRDVQLRAFSAADGRFTAGQHEQPSARRLAIDCQQSRRLRPFQHLRLLSRGALTIAVIQKTNAVPFDVGAAGVSVQYGACPLEVLPPFSASSFARSC